MVPVAGGLFLVIVLQDSYTLLIASATVRFLPLNLTNPESSSGSGSSSSTSIGS